MNVGFYLTSSKADATGYVCADILLRSVRAAMPGVAVTQFTDENSPAVYGVDAVRRKPAAPLSLLRSAHYAEVGGEWLFVDTDVVINRDVSDVFASSPFDIAVADRCWTHLPQDPAFASAMPFNVGVIFSRMSVFWHHVHRRLLERPDLQTSWVGDQTIIGELAQSGAYRVRVLPGMAFNYPPKGEADPQAKAAAIAHFKGPRKAWMFTRIFA